MKIPNIGCRAIAGKDVQFREVLEEIKLPVRGVPWLFSMLGIPGNIEIVEAKKQETQNEDP